MAFFSRKYRRPPLPARPDHLDRHPRDEEVPVTLPRADEGTLTRRMVDLYRTAEQTLFIYGPGDADACFDAASAVMPTLARSAYLRGGVGVIDSNPAYPWVLAEGPSGSALAVYRTGDADPDFFVSRISGSLQQLRDPWRLTSSGRAADTWPRTLADVITQAQAVPIWQLKQFASFKTARRSVTTSLIKPPGRASFTIDERTKITFTERIRHNPPRDDLDTFERIDELGVLLRRQRGSGFEHAIRDQDDRRVDPDWLSTRSLSLGEHGRVASASHLNHHALGRPPALDLGAIDMRNLHTFPEGGHPQGLVAPHHSLYTGHTAQQTLWPKRMVGNVLSVDTGTGDVTAVVTSWGSSVDAVAVVGADGQYRHLTFLEGCIGGETAQLSPDGRWVLVDGGSRAWLVEVASGRWLDCPVANAGWWPQRNSCLVHLAKPSYVTPHVFDLAAADNIAVLPTVTFARSSGVDFLDTAWSPRMRADATKMLVLTSAGVPAESQRIHGTGRRVAIVDVTSGSAEPLTGIFLDQDGELEREHSEPRWVGDTWQADVRLHQSLRDVLQPPLPLPAARDDPQWLAVDARQLAGTALQVALEALQSDPTGADPTRLMPEIVTGLRTTAELHRPSWAEISDWVSGIRDSLIGPLAAGGWPPASRAAWTEYVDTVDSIRSHSTASGPRPRANPEHRSTGRG